MYSDKLMIKVSQSVSDHYNLRDSLIKVSGEMQAISQTNFSPTMKIIIMGIPTDIIVDVSLLQDRAAFAGSQTVVELAEEYILEKVISYVNY